MNLSWLYPWLLILATFVCAALLRRNQSSLKITSGQKFGLGLGAFIGAMIGAKLPFALSDWDGLRTGEVWFAHGKTILAGIIGGYFGVEYTKWCLGIRTKTGDSFAVPVAVGVAIGRLGCFFGGCCFGAPTDLPWACVFPSSGEPLVPRHPTQIYEFIFHTAMAICLHTLKQHGIFRGQLIKLYILAYLAYRFLSEFIRPEPEYWNGFTAYQLAALLIGPIFIGLWIYDARQFAASNDTVET